MISPCSTLRKQPRKNGIQRVRLLLCVPIQLMAVNAERIHIFGMSHQGLDKSRGQHLCNADKRMPQLIGSTDRNVIVLTVPRQMLLKLFRRRDIKDQGAPGHLPRLAALCFQLHAGQVGQLHTPAGVLVLAVGDFVVAVGGLVQFQTVPFYILPAQAPQLPRPQTGQNRESVGVDQLMAK